jgi:phosphoribosylaminoimidazole-succinocarboxamide synthase
MKLLIEGKAKKIFSTKEKNTLVQYFKDDATAFNNKKRKQFKSKGILNNSISALIFKYLNENRIKTHFIKKISEREQIIKKVKIIPLEVVVRNYSAGSISDKFKIKQGTKFKEPIIEFFLKSDELNDPFMNSAHIKLLNIATAKEIRYLTKLALKINILLIKLFSKIGIILVDFKLEFGKSNNEIILADEISPDNCRLWDKKSKLSLDKDLFRHDKGDLINAYEYIHTKLNRKLNV